MRILDTCILIDILRGNLPCVMRYMVGSDFEDFAIPSIVEAELDVGIMKSRHPERERIRVQRLIAPFPKLVFDERCAREYGAVRSQLESDEHIIGPNDLLIAAMAIANDAILVTHNVREFKRVDRLRLEDWAEETLPSSS